MPPWKRLKNWLTNALSPGSGNRSRTLRAIVDASVALDLQLIFEATRRLAAAELPARFGVSSWAALFSYLKLTMAHCEREAFRVLFLDKKNQLVADEIMNQGTVDHAPVYPREVMRRALELSASAVILVHNHPSGDPTPSAADIDMTRRVVEALPPQDVEDEAIRATVEGMVRAAELLQEGAT